LKGLAYFGIMILKDVSGVFGLRIVS
jgi:hypothetical protein